MSKNRLYTGSTPGVNVSVIIINEKNEILLGQRRSGLFAGHWGLPGGKVDLGETLLQAAERETLEETGLAVSGLGLTSVSDIITESAHFVNVAFSTRRFQGEVRELEPDQIGGWRWFDPALLPQPLYHNAAQALEKFRSGRVY
ncbi:MAG: NUDIX domain-containing protein [Firmicutes bacterium]|nr:NUDIX domain-containing protein [Bacillota bacterium]